MNDFVRQCPECNKVNSQSEVKSRLTEYTDTIKELVSKASK